MKVNIHIYVLDFYQVYILKRQIEKRLHFNFTECRKWGAEATRRSLPPARGSPAHCAAPTCPAASWKPREQPQASGPSPRHMFPYPPFWDAQGPQGPAAIHLLPAACVTPWSDELLVLHSTRVPCPCHCSCHLDGKDLVSFTSLSLT